MAKYKTPTVGELITIKDLNSKRIRAIVSKVKKEVGRHVLTLNPRYLPAPKSQYQKSIFTKRKIKMYEL